MLKNFVMLKKIVSATSLLFISALSYSGDYLHPTTGTLVYNDSSMSFSNDCRDSEAFVLSNGKLDLVFNNVTAERNTTKTCEMSIVADVPPGWRPLVSSTFAIGYLHLGDGVVTVKYGVNNVTQENTTLPTGTNTGVLSQDANVNNLECGADITLDAVFSITSLDSTADDALVVALSGSMGGLGSHITWEEC